MGSVRRKGHTPQQGQAGRVHGGSKRARGQGPRAGYDDPRYKASRARLKIIGKHMCAWCRQGIDMQLAYPHPLSWSCDHRTPRAHLTVDDPRHWHIDALAEMHLRCNEARGAKPMPVDRPLDTTFEW